MGLRLCSRCVTPETHETIFFDQEGVCNVCRQQEYKQEKIDWVAREKELHALLDSYRGKKLAKLWLKALGVLLLCMIVIVAVANATGVVDTSAT